MVVCTKSTYKYHVENFVHKVGTLVQLTGVAKPAPAPACVCRLHTLAVRQAALVSDESALEACLR